MLANAVVAALVLAAWMALPTRPTAPRVDGDVVSTTQPAGAASASAAASSAHAVSMPASGTEPAAESTPSAQSAMPVALASPEKASETLVVTAAQAPSASAAASTPVAAETGAAPVAASVAITAPPIPELRRSTRFREPASEPTASSHGVAASAAAAAPPTPSGRFLINVGLFAQDDNARRAHARLRDAGLPAFTQEIQGRSGKLTRVRAGPFATRAEADAAARQIHALQLDAVVLRQ